MSIWFRPYTIEEVNQYNRNMSAHLGIELTAIEEGALIATMPVDGRTQQPFGLLHGGASCVLAETVGSLAASLCVDLNQRRPVGVEINASHLRGVREGVVTAVARPVRLGRRMHVWEIRISDEAGTLVCLSRLTLAIVEVSS